MSTRLSLLSALTLLLVPAGTAAYATPEEVMFPGNSVYNFAQPPTTREIDDRMAEQRQRSVKQREAGRVEAFEAQHPAAPKETQDASGSASSASLEDVIAHLQKTLEDMQDGKDDAADLRNQRILDRVNRQQELQDLSDDQTLHSGAPLTPTGPGTWVAAIAIGTAVAWTILRARPAKRIEA